MATNSTYSIISNSTINNNSGPSSVALKYGDPQDDFLLNSSIVANTVGGVDIACDTLDCVVLGSGNLVESSTGVTFSDEQPITSDPQLGPLASNGGFVTGAAGASDTRQIRTHALPASSPALDKGDSELDIGPGTLDFDQRGPGYPRIQGAGIDIGAYERNYTVPVPALGPLGLGLLSALVGVFAWRRRKSQSSSS